MENTRPRRGKILLKIVVGLVVVVVILIAAAPTILSMGIARSVARDAIAQSIDGDVDIGAVSVGWFSDQSVDGLSLRDKSGANSAIVNVRVRRGLFGVLTSGVNGIEVTVSGAVNGTIEKDGSLGFAKLVKSTSGGTKPETPGQGGGGKGGSETAMVANVAIEGLSVVMTDTRDNRSYGLDSITGTATYDSGKGTVAAQLASATNFTGTKGSLGIKANASNLNLAGDAGGLGKLAFDCELTAKDLKVPAGSLDADFRSIDVSAKSPGLSQSVKVLAKAEGVVDGKTPSRLDADLTVSSLVDSAGAVAFNLANVVGTVEASNLPTSLLQPSLAATDVVASDDIGALIEKLTVRAVGGGAQPIAIELRTPKAQLDASAVVGAADGSVRQGTLNATVLATTATLKRLAKTDVTGDVRIQLTGTNLSWAKPEGGKSPLENFVGRIEVRPLTDIVWKQAQPAPAEGDAPASTPIAVAIGPSTVVAFGRDALGADFFADVQAAVGLGSASQPPAGPASSNVALRADIDPSLGRIANGSFSADLSIQPGFLTAVSGRQFSKPANLKAAVRNLAGSIPGDGLAGIAVDAKIDLVGETALFVDQLKREVPLRDVSLTITATDMAKETVIGLKGMVDTALLDVRETVRNVPAELFAGNAGTGTAFDPFSLDVSGTTKISGLNGASLVAWLGEHKSYIEAAKISNLTIDLTNERLAGRPGQRIALTLGGEPIRGQVNASIERDSASVEKFNLTGSVAEDLIAVLQATSESKVVFAKDVPFTLALERPTTFRFEELKQGKLPAGLAAHLVIDEAVVTQAPGIVGAVALKALDLKADVDPTATAASVKGSFSLMGTTAPSDQIEKTSIDLAWAKPSGSSLLQGVTGTVNLDGVNLPWVESLLGKERGAFSKWTGDDGSLKLTLSRAESGESIRLVPAFPRITSGAVDVLANGERITATAKGVAVRVPAATLVELVTKPGAPADAPRYSFGNDLGFVLSDATVQLPRGLAKEGDPVAGASVNVVLAVDAMSVRVVQATKPAETLAVPAIDATVSSTDLLKGIAITANDRGGAPQAGGAPAGAAVPTFRINGNARNLADAEGKFSAAAAVLDLDVDIQQIPTVLIDLVASTDGSLTRSLGDRIAVKAKAKDLSKTSGDCSATINAPFADLTIPQLSVNKNGIARITEKHPLTATFALSPGIKDEILYAVNTIFADVELVKERASLTVSDLRYSLDGDLAKLDGDILLDVGDVRMRNGRPVSILFALLENKATPGSEGRIEPLAIKISNGRLTYDKFGLKLFKEEGSPGAPPTYKNSIDMTGDINLAQKYVNAITTKLPLSQVANYSGDASAVFAKMGGRDSELAKKLSLGDEKGNFKPLEQSLTLPGLEEIASDPASLIKGVSGLLNPGGGGDAAKPTAPLGIPPINAPSQPAKEPAKAPVKEPVKEPAKDPANDKPKKPAKDPAKEPAKDAPSKPAKDAPKDPAKEKPKDKSKEKPKDPAKDPTKDPAKDPASGDPSKPKA
jgi:hypothetical protein